MTAQPMSTRRERLAWYAYDFGNSAYASVVLLAVYSAYFQQNVVGGAEGTRLWGSAILIAMVVVAVTAPILGAVADFAGSKKRFLFFYTTMACAGTAALFFATRGQVLLGMAIFIFAEIGYRSAQVFYDALLPEIAAPHEIVFVIIVQATNVAGAFLFGQLVDRIGGKRSLILSLVLLIAIVLGLYLNTSTTMFYVIGALAGFAMAGVQSVSRTMVGLFAPPGQSGEFYGFFALSGRTSSFIGPGIYGWLAAEAALLFQAQGQSVTLAEQSGQRVAILSIAIFLFVGLLLLLLVNEKKALAAAQSNAAGGIH